MGGQLGGQDVEPLLQRDSLTGELVVRREARWVGGLGGVALGVQLLQEGRRSRLSCEEAVSDGRGATASGNNERRTLSVYTRFPLSSK